MVSQDDSTRGNGVKGAQDLSELFLRIACKSAITSNQEVSFFKCLLVDFNLHIDMVDKILPRKK